MSEKYSGSADWRSLSIRRRCKIVAAARSWIVDATDQLAEACASDQRTDPVETISAELMPLCSALSRIGRRGPSILRTRRFGVLGRPAWLWGLRSQVRRDPHGTVLILGTWNYPLLLMGVQSAQALAAGNRVLLKPAAGSEGATREMVSCFHRAGVPETQLRQLDSSTEAASGAIQDGVDLIVLTGAASTGRKVMAAAAESLTPAIMELSGCDAVVVTPTADLALAADAISFGLNFNSGSTCIGPRRLIVEDSQAGGLIDALRERLCDVAAVTIHPAARAGVGEALRDAIGRGADDALRNYDPHEFLERGTLRPIVLDRVSGEDPIASADLFAPVTSVIRVPHIGEAVKIVNECRYRLAASVFGRGREASDIADRLRVGSVAINDILVPTADPRLPFGGRGNSGFGVTRGDEGLLAMTVPTVLSRRRGGFMPHLAPRRPSDAEALKGLLQILYARSIGKRSRGLRRILAAVKHGAVGTDENS